MGEPKLSLDLLDKTVEGIPFDPTHPYLVGIKYRRGIALSCLGRDSEALDELRVCSRCFEDLYGQMSRATCNTDRRVALSLTRLGKLDEAYKLYSKVHYTERLILRLEHPGRSTTVSGISRVLIQLGKSKEAMDYCRRQLTLTNGTSIEETFAKLEASEALARVLMAQGRFGMAKAIRREIYLKRIRLHGRGHILTLRAKSNYEDINFYYF